MLVSHPDPDAIQTDSPEVAAFRDECRRLRDQHLTSPELVWALRQAAVEELKVPGQRPPLPIKKIPSLD
jgi:hypothetical protein